ncbi:hypothetical protein HYFRA_00012578 [Hymenoscyphus fraxineus]|uniref:Uncharacterized protein n=1 Tax=Hymenoscyphus fraxineus TaxID=746836 RepID=A0A9N9L7P7_9HELO|nr:hypothetical protein HYFRA_00012578 [Hymenoscyphus fraxineus]
MTPKGLSFVLAAALPLAIASPIAKPYGPYKYSTTLPVVGGLPAIPVPATPPALPPIVPTITVGGADGVTLPAPGLPSLPVSVPSPNGLLSYGGLPPVPTITVGGSDGSFTSLPVVKPIPSLTSTTTIIVTVYPTLPAATIPDIPVPLTTITSLVTVTLPRPPISVGGADGVTFPAPPIATPPIEKPPPPATYGGLPPPPPPPSLPQLPPNVVGGGGILGGLLGNTGGHITPPGTTVPKIGGGGFIGTPNPPSPPNGGTYGGHGSGGGNPGGNSEICDDPFFAEASPLLKQLCSGSGSGSTTSGSSGTSNPSPPPPPPIPSSPAGYNPQYKRDTDSSLIATEDPASSSPPRTPQGLLLQKILEKCVSELGETKGLALCPRALNFIPQSSLPGDGILSDEMIDALIQRGLKMAEEGDKVPASKRGLGGPGQLLSGVSLDEGLGGGALSPEQIEGILAAAVGKTGLPLNGLPLNGLPLNGLPLNGLPLKERAIPTTPDPTTILSACEKAFTQAQTSPTTPKLDPTQICKFLLSYIPKTPLPSNSITPEDLKKIIESVLSSHGLAKRQHYQFGSGGPSESSGNGGLPSTPSTPSNPQYGNGNGNGGGSTSTSGNGGGSSLPQPPPIAPKPPVQPHGNPPYVPTSSGPSPPANGGDLQSSIASSIAAGLAQALGPNGAFNPGTFFGDGNKGGSGSGSNGNGNGKGEGGYY